MLRERAIAELRMRGLSSELSSGKTTTEYIRLCRISSAIDGTATSVDVLAEIKIAGVIAEMPSGPYLARLLNR